MTVPGTCARLLTSVDRNNTIENAITSEHSGKQRPGRAVTSYDDDISGDQLEFHAVTPTPTQRQSTYVCVRRRQNRATTCKL